MLLQIPTRLLYLYSRLPHHRRIASRHTCSCLSTLSHRAVVYTSIVHMRRRQRCQAVTYRGYVPIGRIIASVGPIIDLGGQTSISCQHVFSHDRLLILPSLWVDTKRTSASKVVAFSVPLLPLCQTSHVSGGGFACGPKVGSNSEKVECEDKSDCPFESSGCRCNSIACIGRMAICRKRISVTLSLKVS